VLRLFESIKVNTRKLDLIEVVLCIDEDDDTSHNLDCSAFNVKRIIGPRNTMGHYNSTCLANATGDIIVLSNDDMVIRTADWDERLRLVDSKYQDGIYMAYPNDLYKGAALCAFPILSRRTCELLVDPFPRIYKGAFIDYQLLDIFKRLQKLGHQRLHYMEDVIFEHLHFRTGKSTSDATYVNRQRFGDDAAFLGMVEYRKNSAGHMYAAIEKTNFEPILDTQASSDLPTEISAKTMIRVLVERVVFDSGLPLQWRAFLFYWFCGRTLAANGYLKFLRRH
jgi:hypothetical protein